jgi:hypothetical protein
MPLDVAIATFGASHHHSRGPAPRRVSVTVTAVAAPSTPRILFVTGWPVRCAVHCGYASLKRVRHKQPPAPPPPDTCVTRPHTRTRRSTRHRNTRAQHMLLRCGRRALTAAAQPHQHARLASLSGGARTQHPHRPVTAVRAMSSEEAAAKAAAAG